MRVELIIVTGLVLGLGIAAFQRNFAWKDGVSLWSDVVEKSPQKARPHYNLGHHFIKSGNYDRAVREYNKALSLFPNYVDAHNGLGLAYYNYKD
ncbi:MAG: tetratricopeptide repeat protein [Deltaproteobacteria bacterium]|nr:tetratricopeptide repeat protein [Deltaproteobacteria bacterium]